MSELPTVSVLIPCYNEREWIRTCLDSLLANDYPADRIEFVIIDGGSDDGTLDIITDISREHPNVRVLPNPVRLKPCLLYTSPRFVRSASKTSSAAGSWSSTSRCAVGCSPSSRASASS